MTNGDEYTIGSSDLDKITCLTPGTYSVQEATDNRSYDLVVTEHHLNAELYEAMRKTNVIVRTLNYLSTHNRKGLKKVFARKVSEIVFLQECRGSGRVTKSTATLNQTMLAVAYKVEGRKIARRDAMRTMTHDIQEMNQLLGQIERRMGDLSSQFAEKRPLRDVLEEVKTHVLIAEKTRQMISNSVDISDEPIAKVLYPGGIDPTSVHVWNDYKAWYTEGDRRLHLDAVRSVIRTVVWLSDSSIEVTLEGRPVKYFLSPLVPVEEAVRDDEVTVGDIALLCGQYLVVAEIVAESGEGGEVEYSMINSLRIVSMEEQSSSRRRMNKSRGPDSKVLSIFL